MAAAEERGEVDAALRTTTRLAFGPAFLSGAGGLSLIALPDDILAQVRVAVLFCAGCLGAFVLAQPAHSDTPNSPRRSRTRL